MSLPAVPLLCVVALIAFCILGVNILEALTKTRHPDAKSVAKASETTATTANQTPVKQRANRKRSCESTKPAHMRTNGGENASLCKGAPILASLRNGPSKKQRLPEGPRALPLRPISTFRRGSEVARAQNPARRGRLNSIASFSPRSLRDAKDLLALRADLRNFNQCRLI